MDLLGKMVQGTGCAVDGTVAAQNPLSRAMDSVMQARGGPARSRHAPGPQPGYVGDMQAQMQRQNFARGADAQLLQGFEQEAMHRSRMEAAFRANEMQQHQPMAMMHPHQAAFEAAFEESQHAARFGGPMHHQHHHHHPPPPPFMQQQQRPHTQEAWVDDFQSLHMDDAWQSAGKSHQELAWEETKAPAPTSHQALQQNYTQQFEEASEQVAQDHARQLETRSASSEMARTMSQNPDPKWQQSEFLQFMHKVGAGELELDEEKNAVVGDVPRNEGALEGAWGESETDVRANRDQFEASWQQSGSSMESAFAAAAGVPQHGMEGAWGDARAAPGASATASALDGAWGDSHTAEEKAFEDAWGEGDNLEALWEKAMADARTTDPFEDAWDTVDESNEYTYKAENPFLEASENFAKGVAFFESGRLSEAILAFEAEVQQHPENSEAWRMLGECHAENDEDKSAIVCLERAVEEDPYNLSALLGLGVSNVNELNPQGALKNLKAWVQHNPKFHGLEIQLDEYSDGSLMDEVMQLMLQARAHDPNDSDVHVVLGVLYNVSKDYDAAATSFHVAAQERPLEYALWNKLGATLANSSRSTEAIPSYHRALELKPRYARGWLNLGISHANLGNYEEATKCYLQALSLNQRAEHIWSYLRICFTCMERFDLVKVADTRDVSLFRDEFKLLDLLRILKRRSFDERHIHPNQLARSHLPVAVMPGDAVLSPASRLRALERKRFHEDRKGRIPVMDADTLRELCLENDGYETPELNDNLYAHFQGFQRIAGLEPYANLKALWLESNGLTRIENLTPLTSLRCLYLNKNLIERVEGLESLRELNTLDLSDNRIGSLSGLAHLPVLSSLNLSRNLLAASSDVQELALCAQLTNVDLSHNRIEDPAVLAVLQKVPQLRALRLTGNAVVSTTKCFRKTYIASLPQLAFLDRPIFPMERAAVAAWQAGGTEAELAAKRSFVDRENDERRRTLQEFRDWQAQVREKRIRELDAERALKDPQLRDVQENTPTNGGCCSVDAQQADGSDAIRAGLDAIDLKGFCGLTEEQYARLGPADRAKWDERIERAQADSVAERRQVLGDGVCEPIGASFWAAASEVACEKASPATASTPTKATAASSDESKVVGRDDAVAEPPVCAQETEEDAACVPPDAHGPRETATSWSALATVDESGSGRSVAEDDARDGESDSASSTPSVVESATPFASLPPPPAPTSVSSRALQAAIEVAPPLAPRLSPVVAEPSTAAPTARTAPAAAPPTRVLARDPTHFSRQVGDTRESWAQFEQRARQAPFLHRPLALPSVHSVRHWKRPPRLWYSTNSERELTLAIVIEDSDESDHDERDGDVERVASSCVTLPPPAPTVGMPLHALTREQILHEMRAAGGVQSSLMATNTVAKEHERTRAGGSVTDVAALD
ncbi:hypothetical protein PybrP1_011049 [[Pythium] brassicae (nom. inval.)]|nr:hypothetical protein PybrP1_011049 [[Pythium] brassicae (nom. inval.)]